MTGNLWQGRASAQDAIASTAAGDIWLSPSQVAVVPVEEAWLGLRELHFAAIGDAGYAYTTDAGGLLPDEAQAAYSSAIVGVLGQIAVTDANAGNRLLGSMCDAADLYGGFDGIEGPALSALLSAGRGDVPTLEMDQLAWLWSGMGAPEIPGGNYRTSTLLNAASRDLGFADAESLGRLAESASGGSTRQFQDRVADLVREGVSEVLGEVGFSPQVAKDAANTLGATAEGAALGAAIGSLAGPGGYLVGGLFGGLIALFDSLFGGDDDWASQQRDAARDVASGTRATVHNEMPVQKDGQPTVVSQSMTTTTTTTTTAPDGTTTTRTVTTSEVVTAPANARNPAQQPPQNTCIRPTEVKCLVYDNAIDPDFAVPYWQDRATLLGAGIPLGPGRDGLVAASAANNQWAALRLTELPAVDELGVLQTGGQLLDTVYNQLAVPNESNATWDRLAAQLEEAATHRNTAVPQRKIKVRVPAIINRLRLEGFRPDDPIDYVLRTLRTRYQR